MFVNLAAGFAARGLPVEIVAARAQGPLRAEVPPCVGVADLARPRSLRALLPLARYLRDRRPRFLLSAMTAANLVALGSAALARTGTAVIATEHIALGKSFVESLSWKERGMIRLMRRLYRRAAAVVAVSQGVADSLERAAGVSRERVRVIHNPVVTPDLAEKALLPVDHPFFAPGAPPVVLGAGRLTPQKDFATLLRAVALLRRDRPARLLILGEGEERPALERLAGKLGLVGDLALPGFVPNPYPFFSRAAVLALSSRWEGFGLVLVEAMALGTPVVSTDCESGPAEILDGGRFGPLVPPGEPEPLARAIQGLLDRPPDPGPLRSRAMDFSRDAAVDRYLRLFGEFEKDSPPTADRRRLDP